MAGASNRPRHFGATELWRQDGDTRPNPLGQNFVCLKMLSLSRLVRTPSAMSHLGTGGYETGDNPDAVDNGQRPLGREFDAHGNGSPYRPPQTPDAESGRPKKRKTELQTRERRQSGLNLTIVRSEDRMDLRKLLASFRSDRQVGAELHGSSFFTAASTESNGHDSSGKNDSALHSLSPDSVPEKSGRD